MKCSKYMKIRVSGSPLERGEHYGRVARERVHKNLAFYQAMFMNSANMSWEKAKEIAKTFEPYIEAYYPDGLEEMRGIAQGAGVDYEDILTLNCRSEVLFAQPDGCSCLGVLPTASADGHTYLGQNWDWLRAAGESTVVLQLDQPSLPSILMIVEAGMIGGKGLNDKGIGVCLNAMSIGKGQKGVPLHVMYRCILNADSISNAFDKVARAQRAGSGTFNIGSEQGFVMSLEFTPFNFDVLSPVQGKLCHTNHYLSPIFKAEDTFKRDLTDSFVRLERMHQICEENSAGFDKDRIFALFSDHANHPDSICSHEDMHDPEARRLVTVYSMLMDLTERTLWVTDTNACCSEAVEFHFDA